MAAFPGEDLVTITGPDGVQRQVPSSLANAFQGFSPGGPAAPVDAYTASGGAPAPVDLANPAQVPVGTNLAPPPADPAILPSQGVAQPVTPDGFQQPVTPDGFENAKAPKAKAAKVPKAAKGGAPTPNGYAPVLNAAQQQAEGYDELAQKQLDTANVTAAGDALMADEMADQNKHIDEAVAKREKEAADNIAAQDKIITAATGIQKKLAAQKIDRSIDHPIMAMVGQLLAAFGQAYNRQTGPNPATEILMKMLDRKVANQMADRDLLKDQLGFNKDDLARVQELGKNKLAYQNLVVGAEAEKAARHLEVIAKRTSSDATRAKALEFAQQTRLAGQAVTMDAMKGFVDYDQKERQHAAQIATQRYGIASENMRAKNQLSQNQLFHDDDMDFKREQLQKENELGLAKIRQEKGAQSAQQALEYRKTVAERAIGNVSNGDALLTGEGYKMLDKADQMDQAADALEKSGAMSQEQAARAKMLRENAIATRGEAKLTQTFIAGTGEGTQKLREKYAATQKIASLTDDIQNLYAGKSVLNTDGTRATIQTLKEALDIELKNAWQLGVLSGKDQQKIDKGTGGDPTKYTTGTALNALGLGIGEDDEAFKSRLSTLSKTMEDGIIDDLHTANWDVSDRKRMQLIFHKNAFDKTAEGAAAKELNRPTMNDSANATEDKNPLLSGSNWLLWRPPGQGQSEQADAISSKENKRYPGAGFDDKQAAAMDGLLAGAKSGKKESVDTLVALAGDPKRAPMVAKIVQDALQNGKVPVEVYDAIRQAAPDVVRGRDEAARSLPAAPGMQTPDAVVRGAAKQAAMSQIATPVLAKGAIDGAPGTYDELVKRATTDKNAQIALDIVIKEKAKQAASKRNSLYSMPNQLMPGGK